jgi:hypothetical protein
VWNGAVENTAVGQEILAHCEANKAIFFYRTDGNAYAVCYSHTGLVLDESGQRELNEFILGDSVRLWAEQAKETVEFGNGAESAVEHEDGYVDGIADDTPPSGEPGATVAAIPSAGDVGDTESITPGGSADKSEPTVNDND